MKETIEISQEDLISDPTKDPLYQERLKEWNASLRISITSKRKVLLTHLKQTFHSDASQASLRTLSWTHSKLLNDLDYNQEVQQSLKGMTLPTQFGFNKQESYHQSHFINAVLLSIHRPHTPTFVEDTKAVFVSCVYNPELTTSDRLEEMEKFYHHLLERVPDHDRLEPQRKITITHVYDKLLDIEQKLEDLHGLRTSVPKGTSKT